ncbi:hypothetical protein MKX03_017194 [Papaver bracteatum]|nr:hypothetical protein MKX03_017194 [Papaver bracteatum]
MWESESESARGRDYGKEVVSTSKHGVKTDGFERRDHSWYVATDVPSDLLVQVGDIGFHLHKYPLLSRSGKMNRIIYDSHEANISRVEFDDLPGGSDAFELAAKFCYGIAVDLTAGNISGLRCTAEYLEMTEDLEEGNLIFKTEAFLSYVVLSSWRDSILVLKSCEHLSPWAENLQIVRRCSESIAWKACTNPRSIRWAYTGKPTSISSPKWNEMNESSPGRNQQAPPDWWFEDVSILRIDHFVRVVTAIKVKGMRFEYIGAAIMQYGSKWLPGLTKEGSGDEGNNSRDSKSSCSSSSWNGGLHMIVAGNKEDPPNLQIKEQRMIVESLISIIPPQKDSVSCSFLLRLLRMANMLKVAPALVTELEKRVGMQFEQATLVDLLIPSYNKTETLYDVDLIQRLLEHFLVQEQTEPSSPNRQTLSDKLNYEGRGNAKMRVAKLVDSYLTEVSRDRNLNLTKFQVLAEALPESARTCDDGLYRAVDSYLKAHPTLSEHERKRICRVMDCQKLSIDACMHAAQNERLPLRVVVQVLFSEQVKISNAIANNTLKETGESHYQPLITSRKTLIEATPQSFQEGWSTAKKDINTLKFELESMKTKYLELQIDMENLQRQFDKLSKQKHSSAWTSGWKKLGKLTKMTPLESSDSGSQIPTVPAEQTRKGPRRWRNSIS